MSITLSKGFRLPEVGDRAFWGDLEFNITQLNSHVHNGTDSERIVPGSFNKTVGTLTSGAWTAVVDNAGTFKQTITVPTGYTQANMQLKFCVDGGGEDGFEVHPSVRKVSATTFDVFCNDNSVALKVVYG